MQLAYVCKDYCRPLPVELSAAEEVIVTTHIETFRLVRAYFWERYLIGVLHTSASQLIFLAFTLLFSYHNFMSEILVYVGSCFEF